MAPSPIDFRDSGDGCDWENRRQQVSSSLTDPANWQLRLDQNLAVVQGCSDRRLVLRPDVDTTDASQYRSAHISHEVDVQKKIGLVGFEPTASSSRTRRSTKLSHSPSIGVERSVTPNGRNVHAILHGTSNSRRRIAQCSSEILPGKVTAEKFFLCA
jgi:hypothetical protein